MSAITVEQIKALRDQTGISIAQCKKALEAAGGDSEQALASLRAAGADIVAKKSGRTLGAGVIGQYVHTGGSLGALVELDCETDFVAKTAEFQQLAADLAMHVAAFQPSDVTTLLEQPFVKDQTRTVTEILKDYTQKFGERLEVMRFTTLAVGGA